MLGGGAAITAIGEIAPRRDAGDQTTVELLSRDAGIRAPRRRADELGAAATTALLDAPRGQWDALVARTSNAHGRIDVLVDNAGIRHAARIERETAQAFEDVWRVNALGPFLGVRAVLPAMPQGGAIVNTVSTAALRGNPLGRMGDPEDVADAALYPASPRAGFVTGVGLVVDGGASFAAMPPLSSGADSGADGPQPSGGVS